MDATTRNEMRAGLELVDKIAAAAVADPAEGKSPYVAALRSRVSAAIDALDAHESWLKATSATAKV